MCEEFLTMFFFLLVGIYSLENVDMPPLFRYLGYATDYRPVFRSRCQLELTTSVEKGEMKVS